MTCASLIVELPTGIKARTRPHWWTWFESDPYQCWCCRTHKPKALRWCLPRGEGRHGTIMTLSVASTCLEIATCLQQPGEYIAGHCTEMAWTLNPRDKRWASSEAGLCTSSLGPVACEAQADSAASESFQAAEP